MSARRARAVLSGAAAALALLLGGCTYDYLQHSDRIAYRAGDAVDANLQSETINPSKRSMRVKSGLGKNGAVIPTTTTTASASTGSSAGSATPAASAPATVN